MKKVLVLCMILALAFGATGATCKTNLCSPTADRVVELAQMISSASSVLVYYQSLAPTVPIQAIISGLQLSITLLTQARDGICLDASVIAAAENNIGQATTIMRAMKKGQDLRLSK